MIICHDGLPGSGKSYEAVIKHILPALKDGRNLATNINGIIEGIPKIAELIGVPEPIIEDLIYILTDDDIANFGQNIKKDALIVFDEVQNHYPSGRQKIDPQVVKFVSEHRHHGHDIIIMTQSFADIAPLWRRRTQRKISFFKRTAVGQSNKYTWIAYEATQPEVFKKINSGPGEYDPKYFGTYKSHQDGTENKSLSYEDDRTNIFKQKNFIIGVPIALCFAFYAIYFLYDFFQPNEEIATAQIEPEKPNKSVQDKPVTSKPQNTEKPEPQPNPPIDYFDRIAGQHRLHLSATLSTPEGEITHAIIQALDPQNNLKEQFTILDIQEFGWKVSQKEYGLVFVKNQKTHLARPFPRSDLYGRINQAKRDTL